jgi:LmbE family N-acetylglucosaminyl deacetylase
VLVISPHLDDGVFGCGRWLAAHPGSTVLTVFAGAPGADSALTDWDARSGFASGPAAVRLRREEDKRALALLGASCCWLDFTDSQYGASPSVDAVAEALRRELQMRRPAVVLYPLGLFHSDHRLVHEACRAALAEAGGIETAAYEDALYRGMRGMLQQRLAALLAAGIVATPIELDALPASPPTAPFDAARAARLKAGAVGAYASQLRAFGAGGHADLERPERGWRLEPMATAPEAAHA